MADVVVSCERSDKALVAPLVIAILALAPLPTLCVADPVTDAPDSATPASFTADGRSTVPQLTNRYESLSTDHGWHMETVYAYPGADGLAIRAWRTPQHGKAMWILAGIHGEEPAGPNAIAAHLESIVALAAAGVPVVVIPLCNPKAYRSNWRYPNTP